VIAMTAIQAGMSLKTIHDLQAGRAISADFTGKCWIDQLKIPDIPAITPNAAGVRMARLSSAYSFSIFEYWISDIAGHHQDMRAACSLLATLDDVLARLVHTWIDEEGLILITSDHGNLEDLSTRRHTTNPVPLIMIGASHHRRRFLAAMEKENPGSVNDLTRVAPAIQKLLG
jgi:2,3-bisphosphoglycerate-independent phosphoglycerate mutase